MSWKDLVEGSRIYCELHKEKDRIRRVKAEKKIARVLKIEFLTIDHVNGKGNEHRKLLFKHNVGGVHMYRWLKRNNYPEGYTILCMNCNWAQRYGNICPHQLGGVA